MKFKFNKTAPAKQEEVLELADEAEQEVTPEAAPSPKRKRHVREEPPAPGKVPDDPNRIWTLADIDDDKAYGIHCYKHRAFGTEYRPIKGSRLKRLAEQLFDYGAIRYFNTPSLRRKQDMLLKVPGNQMFAASYYEGEFVDPEEAERRAKRKKFVFRSKNKSVRRLGKFVFRKR